MRLLALLLALLAYPLGAATWLTDTSTAYQQARTENKTVLFNFTGSDWCSWCMRLKSEVFSQPEFDAFANDNLVLVEVDFPKKKQQTPAQIRANTSLAAGYGVRGYPTIVLADTQGKVIGSTGYQPGGPKLYIKELERILGPRVRVPFKDKSPGGPGAAASAPKPPEPKPIFGGARTLPPAYYMGLQLKGISGRKTRPLAIVNNETMAAGETAMVKLWDGQVKVRCEAIRAKSVVIKLVDSGETLELELGGLVPATPSKAPVVTR